MSEWREQPVVFACGPERLLGVVHRAPDSGAQTGALVVVGGPQYRVGSHRQFTLMARSLAAAGFPVMRFDHRGVGDSDGEMRSFESIADDIRAALETFLAAVPSLRRVVLWGLCDAASAALLALPLHVSVQGLILANPWVRTPAGEAQAVLSHYYTGRLRQRDFWAKLVSGGVNPLQAATGLLRTAFASGRPRTAGSGAGYVERMRTALTAFRGPVLLLLSERDLTAQEFSDLCAASPQWRELLSSPNVRVERLTAADHTFSQRAALERAIELSRACLARVASRGSLAGRG
jgi:exosortase A-associated hydrolase 1